MAFRGRGAEVRQGMFFLFFLIGKWAVCQSDSATSPSSFVTSNKAIDSVSISLSADSQPSQRSDSILELDHIVVTATRTERRASQIPASVTVIGRDEVEATPARNIGDLLQTKAGVLTRRTTGMAEGIPSDINIRGVPSALTASRTLILVDGIPTNVSGTALLLANEVPLEAVERVEVVRGPFSSLYGANAYSGVINIITREGTERPRLELSAGGGNWGYWHAETWSGGSVGMVSYALSAGGRGIGNYFGRDSALVRNGRWTGRKAAENYGFRDLRLFGKTRFHLTPAFSAGLHVRYYQPDLGFGKTKKDTLVAGDTIPADVNVFGNKFLIGPELSWNALPSMQVRLWGFFRYVGGEFQGEDIAYFDSSVSPTTAMYEESSWKTFSTDGQGNALITVRLGSFNTLTAGVEALYNRINYGKTLCREPPHRELLGSSDTVASIINGGVFLQDELRLGERGMIVPGVRFDFHSEFQSALSPRLAASFKPFSSLTLRFSAGRGFRAPTLSELYMPPLMFSADAMLISNPDLAPEYIWAADAGMEQRIGRNAVVRVNGFYNLMDGLISPMIVSKYLYGSKYVSYRNISRAWSAGFEVESQAQLWEVFLVQASYTFQQTRDEHFRVPLDYAPRHKLGAGLRVVRRRGPWSLNATINGAYGAERWYLEWQAPPSDWHLVLDSSDPEKPYKNSSPPLIRLDDYATVDMGARIDFRGRVWVGADLMNLTDAQYQESGGTLAPGRTFAISIGLAW